MRRRLEVNHPSLTLDELRKQEKVEKDGRVKTRIQAVRLVWENELQNEEIARLLRCSRNRINEWVQRFNEEGVLGLRQKKGQGRKPELSPEQMDQVRSWIQKGPTLEQEGFPTWNAPRLQARIESEFGVKYGVDAVYKLLHRLGACWGKGRKIPAKGDPAELEEFKKKIVDDKQKAEEQGRNVRIFFEDEAVWSLTTDIGYVWHFPKQRPELLCAVSRTRRYAIGAVEPESGEFFSLLMPWLNTDTFQIFLDEFAKEYKKEIELGVEFWMYVDKAGWHTANGLKVPEGIELKELPTGAAQINPIERLWLYIRDHWTRSHIWKDVEELEEVLCTVLLGLMQSFALIRSVCSASFLKKAA